MNNKHSRTLRALPGALLAASSLTVATSAPASATVTPLKMAVFQGNLTAWIAQDGLAAVAGDLAQADLLVITNAFSHTYGGSEWTNPRGCQDVQNDHDAWVNVLDYIDTHASTLGPLPDVYGYVAGPADAPDQTAGGVTREAFCGNTVNNYRSSVGDPTVQWPPGSGHNTKLTTFASCPGGTCQNFIDWVNQWVNTSDSLSPYVTGIFIDYLSSEKVSATTRDNLYSYVHLVGKHIMVNSTAAGAPCVNCTSSNGDSGSIYNYQFAADSSYLDANDYVMVEGYYWAGVNNNGGVARDDSAKTTPIAGIRTTLKSAHGNVEPHLAALITEPTDGAFSSLSCAWSDYTSARSAFMQTAIAGDAISYQFSDYGTVGTGPNHDQAPVFPIPYCG